MILVYLDIRAQVDQTVLSSVVPRCCAWFMQTVHILFEIRAEMKQRLLAKHVQY